MEMSLFPLGVAKFGIGFQINKKQQKEKMSSKLKSEVGRDPDATAAFVIFNFKQLK